MQSLLRIQQAEAALRRAHDELEQRVRDRTAELASANAALRSLSLRLVEVQEKERRFLSRELHDEVGQVLTGLKMVLDQSLPLASETLRERLGEGVAAEKLGVKVDPKAGNVLQGVGNLLTGQKATTTNQPSTNTSPKSKLLDILKPTVSSLS